MTQTIPDVSPPPDDAPELPPMNSSYWKTLLAFALLGAAVLAWNLQGWSEIVAEGTYQSRATFQVRAPLSGEFEPADEQPVGTECAAGEPLGKLLAGDAARRLKAAHRGWQNSQHVLELEEEIAERLALAIATARERARADGQTAVERELALLERLKLEVARRRAQQDNSRDDVEIASKTMLKSEALRANAASEAERREALRGYVSNEEIDRRWTQLVAAKNDAAISQLNAAIAGRNIQLSLLDVDSAKHVVAVQSKQLELATRSLNATKRIATRTAEAGELEGAELLKVLTTLDLSSLPGSDWFRQNALDVLERLAHAEAECARWHAEREAAEVYARGDVLRSPAAGIVLGPPPTERRFLIVGETVATLRTREMIIVCELKTDQWARVSDWQAADVHLPNGATIAVEPLMNPSRLSIVRRELGQKRERFILVPLRPLQRLDLPHNFPVSVHFRGRMFPRWPVR